MKKRVMRHIAAFVLAFAVMAIFPTIIAHATGDPTGASLGGVGDIPAKTAGAPTLEEVAIVVGHNKVSINLVWTLITGFLVMFMQAGFAMVETGFTRAKNVAHTMAMNFMVYPLGMLGFWICGFAFMFGGVGPLATLGGESILTHPITVTLMGKSMNILGWKGFFLAGDSYAPGIYTMFLFQMVFMDTTATIPTGAMAERWRFLPFCLYGLLVGGIIYPVYGNWVWGGGWLATLGSNFGLGHGHVDFAGSSVVHMTGGVIALVGAKLIGPRVGKYNKDGSPNAIPGHHIPMAVVGTFILCFGWFGFNPGSTLAGTDLRIGVIATNTMLAGAAGAFTSMVYMWMRFGKPDISMICNGMLAGLVAITAPCAFVTSVSAVIIGALAGIFVIWAVFFVERVLKIDDPVGAIAVHGVNGAWGVLSLGLFADGTYGDGWNGVPGAVKGLFYGDSSQFIAQCVGTLTNFVAIGLLSLIVFKIIGAITKMRSSDEDQEEGLDIPEIGVVGYPEFAVAQSTHNRTN
jgi:ammonium transporter, Amt family